MSSMRRTMSSGSSSRFMQGQSASTGTASPAGGLWSGASTPASEAEGLNLGTQAPVAPKQNTDSSSASTTSTSTLAPHPESNTTDTQYGLTRLDSKEEREVGDKFTPLVSASAAHARKQSTVNTAAVAATSAAASGSSSGGGGGGGGALWGAKATPKAGNGLWGPPKLDDVYEHRHGPKRRWTVTEREE